MDISILHKYFLDSSGVSTDTRTIKTGQIYFALKGDNFDGNQYADQALEKGANYAVVDGDTLPYTTDTRYIRVDDTLKSLQALAKTHRQHCKAIVIGVTGSNGKTTTKELLRAVLSSQYQVSSTKGNLNNHIGVPLTLLSVSEDIEYSIVEMGANNPTDIEELCQIAQPDFGYITNIGSAHLEGFGDIKGVYQAKTALFRSIESFGVKYFVNQFDPLLVKFSPDSEKAVFLSESLIIKENAQVQLALDYDGHLISTQLTGDYNLDNVNAAVTLGKYFNVPIDKVVQALENYVPANRRSQIIEMKDHTLILDAYNANPSSMRVALSNAVKVTPSSHRSIAIIGDMYELGSESLSLHKEIIEFALSLGFSKLVLIGRLMEQAVNQLDTSIEIALYKSSDLFKPVFESMDKSEAVILIKASRGVKLESLID